MTPMDTFLLALAILAFLAFLFACGWVTHKAWRWLFARDDALGYALHGPEWTPPDAGLALVIEDRYEEPESPALAEAYALLADLKTQGAPMWKVDEALDVICALTPRVGVE